jgi:hypothetical protein
MIIKRIEPSHGPHHLIVYIIVKISTQIPIVFGGTFTKCKKPHDILENKRLAPTTTHNRRDPFVF